MRQHSPQPDDLPGYLFLELEVSLQSVGEHIDRVDLLVAVSGGMDSTVLLHALAAIFPKERLFPVHFNYHLRGDSSNQDQAFIEDFCRRLDLECKVIHLDPKEVEAGGNIQDWARKARYDRLMRDPRPKSCAVLTAHHAQDQVETILYRILKGYPPSLCSGMSSSRVWKGGRPLVRPLLHTAPQAIRQYAEAHALSWREDASNQTDAYARNRIRHHLLPALNAAMGQDWQQGLLSFARQLTALSSEEGSYSTLPLERLAAAQYPGRILSQVIGQYVSPGRADEVVRTLAAGRLKAFRTDLGTFMLDREGMVLFVSKARLDMHCQVEQLPAICPVPGGGSVNLEEVNAPPLAYLPSHAESGSYYVNLVPPFVLRRPKPQDRIALIGRQGETKVKDLLEKQPSIFLRETAWVLEKDGEIAFVSTGRIARRASVTPGQACLRLKLEQTLALPSKRWRN